MNQIWPFRRRRRRVLDEELDNFSDIDSDATLDATSCTASETDDTDAELPGDEAVEHGFIMMEHPTATLMQPPAPALAARQARTTEQALAQVARLERENAQLREWVELRRSGLWHSSSDLARRPSLAEFGDFSADAPLAESDLDVPLVDDENAANDVTDLVKQVHAVEQLKESDEANVANEENEAANDEANEADDDSDDEHSDGFVRLFVCASRQCRRGEPLFTRRAVAGRLRCSRPGARCRVVRADGVAQQLVASSGLRTRRWSAGLFSVRAVSCASCLKSLGWQVHRTFVEKNRRFEGRFVFKAEDVVEVRRRAAVRE